MSDSAPTYRLLTRSDIPQAQGLRDFAKWNQTDADWENLLAFEPDGCFAAQMDGRLVGTATCTRYTPDTGPGSFGWVGMVLVHPDYRRHGIGSTMLKTCISYLKERGVETVKLDATPMGRLVYEKLGFTAEYDLERWEGTPALAAPAPSDGEIRQIAAGDLSNIIAYDTPIFGADRSRLLYAWVRGWPECALVAMKSGKIAGYCLARHGKNFEQIGPVIGEDAAICEALFHEAARRIGDKNIIVDIVTKHPWSADLAKKHGLTLQRPFLRMAFGANSSPGIPERSLAICCPELG